MGIDSAATSPSNERECLVAQCEQKRDLGRSNCAVGTGITLLVLAALAAGGSYFLSTDEGASEFEKEEGDMERLSWRMMHPQTQTTTTTTTARPVITFVTAETRGNPLLKSVGSFEEEFNSSIINIGMGHQWHNFKTKVKLLQAWLDKRAEHEAKRDTIKDGREIIVFVDGSDVFWGGCRYDDFVKTYQNIVSKSGASIVFSAEVVCGEQDCNRVPEIPNWAVEMANGKNLSGGFWKEFAVGCKGTWNDKCSAKRDCGFWAPCAVPPAVKFLNSGFFMGPVEDLKDMLDWTWENYDNTSVWGDQSSFAVYWLDGPKDKAKITLDYSGDLALSLSDMSWKLMHVEGDTVRNTALNRTQCLIHGNGRGIFFMKHVLKVLTGKKLFKTIRGW